MENLNKENIRLQLLLLSASAATGTSAILEDARKYLDFVEDKPQIKSQILDDIPQIPNTFEKVEDIKPTQEINPNFVSPPVTDSDRDSIFLLFALNVQYLLSAINFSDQQPISEIAKRYPLPDIINLPKYQLLMGKLITRIMKDKFKKCEGYNIWCADLTDTKENILATLQKHNPDVHLTIEDVERLQATTQYLAEENKEKQIDINALKNSPNLEDEYIVDYIERNNKHIEMPIATILQILKDENITTISDLLKLFEPKERVAIHKEYQEA